MEKPNTAAEAVTDAVRTFDDVVHGMTPEDAEIVQKYLQVDGDRKCTQAIETYKGKHPPESEMAKQLSKRLEKLETAHTEYVKSTELKYHVFKQCTAMGVDHSLVADMAFKDAKTADAKIRQIAEAVKTQEIREINERAAMSMKPGSGNGHDGPGRPMSFQERIDLINVDERLHDRLMIAEARNRK